jgi:molybdopterin molybdotransferase
MEKKQGMISFEEALKFVEKAGPPPASEEIPLIRSLHRVLAADVVSDIDMPPYDKSAMDGFACRHEDLGHDLVVIEEIPAGTVPKKCLEKGQCARIMTGAMLPMGADTVVMKEIVSQVGYNTIRCTKISEQNNICYKGEDVKTGDCLVPAGTRLNAAHLAVMAAAGCIRPSVYIQPVIAVLSTGTELVEPDRKPASGKIRNSNGIQLTAQCLQYGLPADYLGIVRDDREKLLECITAAVRKYQVTIISGGVAVGDFDFVPAVLNEMNVSVVVHGVNVKPGKHFLFGEKSGHYIIGLPGNPVSSFVLFEMFVKPLLDRLSGHEGKSLTLSLPLAEDYRRKKSDVLWFIPVAIEPGGAVRPLEYHGSAHINAYTGAGGIMEIPAGMAEIKKGEKVNVRPL